MFDTEHFKNVCQVLDGKSANKREVLTWMMSHISGKVLSSCPFGPYNGSSR